jgi:hypothetical protein
MAGAITTVQMDDFSGGIDRRVGFITKDARKFYDVENYVLTAGRKLKRRPRISKSTTVIPSVAQGLVNLDGTWMAVAPKGTTDVADGVALKLFDYPDNALTGTGNWEVLDFRLVNNIPVALIRHTFDSDAPLRHFLHVWDDDASKDVTWVRDPACPTTWARSLPLHAYGPGVRGSYLEYDPVVAVAGDKLHISRPDADVAYSATLRPRVWSSRDPADILTNGEWFYFIGTKDSTRFRVPVLFTDLNTDKKFAAYVCEYCKSDGTWVQFTETPGSPSTGQYQISRTSSFSTATTYLNVGGSLDGLVIRFRVFARPPVEVQAGCYLTTNAIIGGTLVHQGASHNLNRTTFSGLGLGDAYYAASKVPGAPSGLTLKNAYAVPSDPTQLPMNGQARYWLRIVALGQTVTSSAFDRLATGTVKTTAGYTNVVGTSTSFLNDFRVGGLIEINGERRNVATISSNTKLEVDVPFSLDDTGATALIDPTYQYAYEVGDTGNKWYAEQEARITFKVAGKDDAGTIPASVYDNSGKLSIAMAPMQNRLLIQFPNAIQSWAVGPKPVTDLRLLSVEGTGAGQHTRPQAALMDGYALLPTVGGPRMFAPSGNNKDYIESVKVGDMLKGIDLGDLRRATFWPALRSYVTCTAEEATPGAGTTFYVLTNYPDSKLLAWSTWTVSWLSRVDDFFIVNDHLYFRVGQDLYLFNQDNPEYVDLGSRPYTSRARWLYNDFGQPQRNKRVIGCDIAQTGKSKLKVYMNPKRTFEASQGPTTSGYSIGQARIPFGVLGPAIGLELESTDETGHELECLSVNYILLNR